MSTGKIFTKTGEHDMSVNLDILLKPFTWTYGSGVVHLGTVS